MLISKQLKGQSVRAKIIFREKEKTISGEKKLFLEGKRMDFLKKLEETVDALMMHL